MSEMVERVARAINPTAFEIGPAQIRYAMRLAHVAIEAMREPTDAMLEQGPPEPYMDGQVWGKMIDAALGR